MITGLGIDLTHKCNLKCSFCWKFVEDSDYEMTINQVMFFCRYFGNIKTKKLRITGGEPLMHPDFKKITLFLLSVFPVLQVTTNGMLLDDTYFYDRVNYVVTPYEANKKVIERFKDKIIVLERPFGYFDRNHDPCLTEKRAKRKHTICGYKQLRVIGDNLYDCCHAQTMERQDKCTSVHTKVGKGWQKHFHDNTKNRWIECVHCFVGDGGRKI